jgi:hypothetical protein
MSHFRGRSEDRRHVAGFLGFLPQELGWDGPQSLMTPTKKRITRTMTITPMIPTPPREFISTSYLP